MTSTYLLGLDAGGGGGRALLLEPSTGKCVSAYSPWTFQETEEGGGWGYNLDPERFWASMCQATRAVLEQNAVTPAQVAGVALSGMRYSLVLLDAEGKCLAAWPNIDARAAGEASELAADNGLELHQRTGQWPLPIGLAPRYRHLIEAQPQVIDRTARILGLVEYFAFRMCGELATDPTQAASTQLLDARSREWPRDLLEELCLPLPAFLPIHPAGHRLGELRPDAAREMGLRSGTPLILGGADTQCALLGAGATTAGDACAVLGTTCTIQLSQNEPVIDSRARVWTLPHILPEQWVLESNAGAMGRAIEWMAQLLFPSAPHPISSFLAESARSSVGAEGLWSTFGAEVMNASAMSLPMGSMYLSPFAAAADPTRRRHLARAVVEGALYALRANLEQLEEVAGARADRLLVTGGLTRSPTWTRLLAEVTGRRIRVSSLPEATALGAAVCAGVGVGIYGSLEEGAAQFEIRDELPDPASAEAYDSLYSGWLELRGAATASEEAAASLLLQRIAETDASEEAPGIASVNSSPEVASTSISEGSSPEAASADITDNGAREAATATSPEAPQPETASAFSTSRESRPRPRILVTSDLDQSGLRALEALGEVEYASYREAMRLLTGPDLVEALHGFQVFITEVDVVDAEALRELPELRVIATCRGNAVNIDIEACTAMGIPVLHAPGRNADAVAEAAIGYMLLLSRKLIEANSFLREAGGEAGDMARMGQAHEQLQGHELWGRTIGLVGFGAVGREVAARLLPFGAQLLIFDPFQSAEAIEALGGSSCDLQTLLRSSDIVSLHAPVNSSTRGLIGSTELAIMKKGALLINTARAALLDETALLEVLRTGHLAGAAMDVFSVEPPGADDPLLALPNVIATPHVAGNTFEIAKHQGTIISEDLARMVRGLAPKHLLNPEALTSFSWHGTRKELSAEELERLSTRPGPAVTDLEVEAQEEAHDTADQEPKGSEEAATHEMEGADKAVARETKGAGEAVAHEPERVDEDVNEPTKKASKPVQTETSSPHSVLGRGWSGLRRLFKREEGSSEQKGVAAHSFASAAQDTAGPEASSAATTRPIDEPTRASGASQSAAPADTALPAGEKHDSGAHSAGEKHDSGARPPGGAHHSGAQLRSVLEAFLEATTRDPALAKFAEKQKLCIHYVLSDFGIEFHMILEGGQVASKLGPPSTRANVRLKMKAAVFDGMLTEKINGPRAAMTGKLSFTGDTRKAMGMQRINKDMCRLYKEARDALGGPGDLSAPPPPDEVATNGPGQAPATPGSVAPSGGQLQTASPGQAPLVERPRSRATAAKADRHPGGGDPQENHPSPTTAPLPSIPSGDPRWELVEIVQELYGSGLITSTGGNLSVRIPDTDELWMTPSQLPKGNLRPEVMVRVDMAGNPIDPDAAAPTSERMMHCAVFRSRPEVGAVIHAHAPKATILAMCELPFLPISTEAAFMKDLPRVPFIMPGTDELAAAVAEKMGKDPAVLLQNHGILVAASTLRRAGDLVEIIERTSELILGCVAVGKEPPVLEGEVVEELRALGELMA